MIGKIIANRYEVIARVGEGGMAVVYRARDLLLGRIVALKVLRPQYASDNDFVERFRREAQTAASLSHPNVVNIHDVGEEGKIYYIVMEFVEGRNLKEIIKQEGPLPTKTAVFIAGEICKALEAAHRQGLTHRDVKPHNILITYDGRVKVTDFGIARAAATSSLTQTGTVIGSVHYFSPEQARGAPVGTASDIYSLGVLCYEMVTGNVPFSGESPVSVALKHLQEQPKPPRQINPQISPEFERIILKAMAKTESQRYPSATAMLRELRGLGEEYEVVPNDEEDTQPMTPISLSETSLLHVPEGEVVPKRRSRKRTKKGSNVWLWAIAMVSFLGGLFWAGTALPGYLFPNDIRVPSVIGLSLADAEIVLKEVGLNLVEEHSVYDATVPVNHIISQDPRENRRVRLGQDVKVTFSKGPEYVVVPDVLGLPIDNATTRLTQVGLQVGRVEEESKPGGGPGNVIRQSPAGGSRLSKNDKVDLVIVASEQQGMTIVVPDLRELTVSAAQERLEALGLKIGATYSEPEPSALPGTIYDQNPQPGTEVAAGSSVDLIYAPLEIRPQLLSSDSDAYTVRTITIPANIGVGAEVIIETVDDFGKRVWYQGVKKAGEVVSVDVRVRGNNPVARVYLNGNLFQEVPL
jgi:serine/threonine protein kinase